MKMGRVGVEIALPAHFISMYITTTPELDLWRGDIGFEYTLTNLLRNRSRGDILSCLIQPPYPKSILEVGCNIGNNLRELRFTGAKLVGVDPQQMALYTRPFEENTFFDRIMGTSFYLPFKKNEFDLVLLSNVLCHVAPQDFKWAAQECFRVGQKIMVVDYFSDTEEEMNFRGTRKLWKRDFTSQIIDITGTVPVFSCVLEMCDKTRPVKCVFFE